MVPCTLYSVHSTRTSTVASTAHHGGLASSDYECLVLQLPTYVTTVAMTYEYSNPELDVLVRKWPLWTRSELCLVVRLAVRFAGEMTLKKLWRCTNDCSRSESIFRNMQCAKHPNLIVGHAKRRTGELSGRRLSQFIAHPLRRRYVHTSLDNGISIDEALSRCRCGVDDDADILSEGFERMEGAASRSWCRHPNHHSALSARNPSCGGTGGPLSQPTL